MTEFSDNELEAIRQRKLAQMQKENEAAAARQKAIDETKARIEAVLKNILTPDAWDQWNSAKLANQANAFIAAEQLIALVQSGKIRGKITKTQIKGVLAAIYSQTHRETKIRRK